MYDTSHENTVKISTRCLFINFLKLILLMTTSLDLVGVAESAVKSMRKELHAYLVPNGESRFVKPLARKFAVLHGIQTATEVSDADLLAAYIMQTQKGFFCESWGTSASGDEAFQRAISELPCWAGRERRPAEKGACML